MGGCRTARARGREIESFVADRLAASGWQILAQGVHAGRSELDVVAVDPGPPARLVVLEVRWRRSRAFGLPEETVDRRKRAMLRRGVARLLEAGLLPDGRALPSLPIGLDLVVVEPPVDARGDLRLRHHRDLLAG
ncbi:MAG: YraN family protein [Candidatus Limnocylindrales bacterium]